MNNEAQTQSAEETTALPLRGDDQAATPEFPEGVNDAAAPGHEPQDSLDVEPEGGDSVNGEGYGAKGEV